MIVPRLRDVVSGSDRGGISSDTGWAGGGAFKVLDVEDSMYSVANGTILLEDWATNGAFARAVAAQLGFTYTNDYPFCAERGRMKLAVFDGAVGPEECEAIVGKLQDMERVTIVAKLILPDAEERLRTISRGSRIMKAPRDLLSASSSRDERRRRWAR